jgi:hypothetical protein
MSIQNQHITFLLITCSVVLSGLNSLYGQIVYATTVNSGGGITLFSINLATCESCIISPTSSNYGSNDIVFLPDGTLLNIDVIGLRKTPPPPATNIIWQTGNPQNYTSGQLAPNGLVYLVGSNGLASYNPTNNTISYIGPWPSSVTSAFDIFYIDGVLYANGFDQSSNGILIEINVTTPAQSIVTPFSLGETHGEGGNWNGTEGLFYADASHTIYFYNPQNESSSTVCDIDFNYSILGITSLPPGLPIPTCQTGCISNAGVLSTGGPYSPCQNSTFSFSTQNQPTLDSDDLLQYIFFSNPLDTLGSILATSSSPSFNFVAPMQLGINYYVAAIVGNALNGSVDVNDPCLSISNALQLTWKPLPTALLSIPTTDWCAGNCQNLTVTMTGTSVFTLSGNLLSAGNAISTFNASYTQNTGLLNICVPAGTPAGALTVQITSLIDAWCICE